jgi:hypothetical protein
MVGHRRPVTSGKMTRRKYCHHGQTNDNDPGGQQNESVIGERLGGLSGLSCLRIDVRATLKRVLSSI